MGSASAWWSCPHSRSPCVTALQPPGRQLVARLLAVPCSTSRSWRAASKAPAGLMDIQPRSLLFLLSAQASAQLGYPLEVPSLPLTQTASPQAEEGMGPGARDHSASVAQDPSSCYWW